MTETQPEQPKETEKKLEGGKLQGFSYYHVHIADPMTKGTAPYLAECADIIEALGMTFNEGENFKALWRLAAARQGRGKPGAEAVYDADKVAHYGSRVAAQTRRECGASKPKTPQPVEDKPITRHILENFGALGTAIRSDSELRVRGANECLVFEHSLAGLHKLHEYIVAFGDLKSPVTVMIGELEVTLGRNGTIVIPSLEKVFSHRIDFLLYYLANVK